MELHLLGREAVVDPSLPFMTLRAVKVSGSEGTPKL